MIPARLQASSVRTLRPGDAEYPALLAAASDAPETLHVRGALADAPAVAIVGSRRPTPYGRRIARKLATEAARAGIAVVSGLARGVDTEAHRAALEAGGITWAVLGSGLDQVYPAENRPLAEQIARSGGAVLSELPMSAGPQPFNFPRRNRIISGLSFATVVVEGLVTSGSLITARCATEQGREVGAVPGPADSPMSEGPLRLLRDGAAPIGSFEDVWALLPPGVQARALTKIPSSAIKEAPGEASPEPYKEEISVARQKVLKSIGQEAKSLEAILEETRLDVAAALRILAELEIGGVVSAFPGQTYALR